MLRVKRGPRNFVQTLELFPRVLGVLMESSSTFAPFVSSVDCSPSALPLAQICHTWSAFQVPHKATGVSLQAFPGIQPYIVHNRRQVISPQPQTKIKTTPRIPPIAI